MINSPLRIVSLIAFAFILCFSFAQTAHADITTGLIDRWALDEGTGTTAADSGSNNNPGTLTNGPAWVAGQVGSGALRFDGVDDKVTVGNPSNLQNLGSTTAGFSVSAWVKPTEYTVSAMYLASKLNVSTLGWYLAVSPGANDGYQFSVDYSGANDLVVRTRDQSVAYGQWQHVLMTWDGTASTTGVRIYINGVENGSTTAAYDILTDGEGSRVSDAPYNFNIGNNTGGTRTLLGDMDEVRVYSRVLSPSDAVELYNYSAADVTAPVLSNYATSSTASAATIQWTTNENSTSMVVYGTASGVYGFATSSASLVTSHTLAITGLSPSTTYFYRMSSTDAANNTATSSELTVTTGVAGDSTPPTVSVTAPTNGTTVSGASVTVSATTTDNVGVAGVQFRLDGTTAIGAEDTSDPFSVTWDSTGVSDGSHTIIAVARDGSGNIATSSAITVTVDNTAPVRSNGSPSSILAFNTSTTTLSLTTNEIASCRYSLTSGLAFGSMTAFTNTASTTHSEPISGLSNGVSYTYYVKCQDVRSNTNATDYSISFSVGGGGGLIGRWNFEEGSGTTVADLSGNGNTGTLVNSPTWVSGQVGTGALQFNSDGNDRVNIGTQSLFTDMHPITISAWIKPTERANEEYILSKINSTTLGWKLSVSTGANDGINFSVDYDNTDLNVRTRDGSVTYGAWQHVVVTWDGSTDAANTHIYINGVENGSSTAPTYDSRVSGIGNRISDSGRTLIIGNTISENRPYEGVMDDVRLYDSVLTPQEVSALYGTGADNVLPTFSVTATSTASTSAIITWTSSEAVNGKIEYGLSSTYSASTTVEGVASTSHVTSISGLTPNTLYHYRIRATDLAGNVGTSSDFTFTTAADTDKPIISGIATSSGPITATIQWTTNELANSVVNFGTTTSYGYSSSSSALSTGHSLVLTGLANNTTYHYQISTTDSSGNTSTTSDAVVLTTSSDTTPPTFSGFASSTSGSTATITWTTDEPSDSQVAYGTTASYGFLSTLNGTASTSHSITITGLVAGTTYHFKTLSRDVWGNLGSSTDRTFKTKSGPTICGIGSVCLSLEDNMTWVVLGDSITDAHYYSDYLEAYFHLRYPNLKLHFRGEGRGGSTIPEASDQGRYDRRVYSWSPDIVSEMFGHNGNFTATEYRDDLVDLIDNYIVAKNGATPVLFGPHPAYSSTGKPTLGDFSTEIAAIATSSGYVYADIWHTLQPIWSSNLASTTPVDLQYDGDGTHPGPSGHLGIAYTLLSKMQAEGDVSAATINASTKSVSNLSNATISSVATTSVGIDFNRLDARLPMAFDDSAREIFKLMPEVLDMNRYMLTVTNLTSGTYEVYVDNVLSGTTTAAELASGWNMSKMTQGPIHDQLLEVLGRIRDKEGKQRTPISGTYTIPTTPAPWQGVSNYKSRADNGYNNLGYRGDDLKAYLQPAIDSTAALDELIYTAADPVQRSFSLRLVSQSAPTDTTAPSVSMTAPTNSSTVSGSAVTVSATATDNVSVGSVHFVLDGTTVIGPSSIFAAPYSFSWDTTQVAAGSHTIVAVAEDSAGNIATSSARTITVDNAMPIRSNGAPSGTLALGTATTTLSLTTNKIATCKYSINADASFASMTLFATTTGTTSHSTLLTGLTSAGSYVYNVKCQDPNGITNTDDYAISFTVASDSVSPVVAMTAPANSSFVSGTAISLAANATDNVGVIGVQFILDGVTNIGAEDLNAPYQVNWDSTAVSDGIHTLSAIARDAADNSTLSSVITVTVDNTAPVRSNTFPSGTLGLDTVSTLISVDTNENASCKYATSSSVAYGSMTSFTVTGNQTHNSTISSLANGGSYTYYVKCQDARGNTNSTNSVITFTVAADETIPTVAITSPSNLAVVSGSSVSIVTAASDDVGIVGIQFKLDGVNLGAEDTVFPYQISWNSTTVADGAHTLVAVARDAAGNVATSSDVNIRTSNRNPAISSVSSGGISTNAATIQWVTDEIATTQIEYGTSTAYTASSTLDSSLVTNHSVSLGGLAESTTYHYRVLSRDESGNLSTSSDMVFTTATVATNPSSGGGGGYSGGGSGGGSSSSVTTNNTTTVATPVPATSQTPVPNNNPATSTVSQNFTGNLTTGASNANVKRLQQFLNANGFSVAKAGAGSAGNETVYFGPATRAALAKFQLANKIYPANGYFGPITRGVVNKMIDSGSATPQTSLSISNPSATSNTASLKLGSSGDAVKNLRIKLRGLGYFAAYGSSSEVPASSAAETDTFGAVTEAAVRKYQCDKKIVCSGNAATTGWGLVGPRTKAALNL